MIFSSPFHRTAVFAGDHPVTPLLSLAGGLISALARASRAPRLSLAAGQVSAEFRS